jgi:hypothetical protein
MKIYRFISTIKAKETTGKQPTHYLVAKPEQTTEKGEFVASLWAKSYKNKDGEEVRFLSGEMKAQWTDHNDQSKSREGFVIVNERELNKLLAQTGVEAEEVLPEEEITPEDIPF